MPVQRLSQSGQEIGSLQPGEARYEVRDSAVRGLRLRVSPAGVKVWSLQYKTRQGKGSRFTLGEFTGTKDGMGLNAARARARKMKEYIKEGGDPQADLQATRVKEKSDEAAVERAKIEAERGTVLAIGTAALAAMPLRPRTKAEWERMFHKEIVPAFGATLAKDLTQKAVEAWGDQIKERAPILSNRAHNLLLRLFGWASKKRRGEDYPILAFNHLAGIPVPAADKEEERDRVLSADELQAILRALDAIDLLAEYPSRFAHRKGDGAAYVSATRLLLETGVRREAVIQARRDEFTNLDDPERARWTVPPEHGIKRPMRSKRKSKPHLVPLTAKAIQIVKARLQAIGDGNQCLFPVASERKHEGGDRPMFWSAHYVAFLKEIADVLHGDVLHGKPMKPMENWRVHDFRRAVASHLRDEKKIRRDIVSLILGHNLEGPASTAIYDHSELLDERRAALAAWSSWLENLRTGAEMDSKVLLFARPA